MDVVGGVDGAHHELGVPGDLDDRTSVGHPAVHRDHRGFRRVGQSPVLCRVDLLPSDRGRAVEELAGQVPDLDDVDVDQRDPSDSEPDQRLQHPGTKTADAEQQDVRASSRPMEVGAGAVEIGEEIVEAKVAAVTRQAGRVKGVVAAGLLQQPQIVELADGRGDLLGGERVAVPAEFVNERSQRRGCPAGAP